MSPIADAYTGTSAVDYDQTAWNLATYYALRPQLYADQFATIGTSPQSTPGTAVTFTFASDLAAAITPLTETVTPDSVAMADTQSTLTLAEYGNVVKPTRFIRATSFLPFDPIVANVVGYNAALSIDTLAMNVLNNVANTNVLYSDITTHVTRVTQASTDIITPSVVRKIFAKLAGANVQPFSNGLYTSFIHPDVAVDLRQNTDLAGWRAANVYVDTANIMSGDMGEYEGFRFIRSPRAGKLTDAGVTTTDVYQTLFFGQDAFAKAYAVGADSPGPYPSVRPGPVVDPLYRFAPMGWYWIGAYGVFRQAALYRLETASSVGVNT